MSVEQHQQAFTAFVAGLLGDFDRYLESGDVDLARDLVGYRQAALYLSDKEMRQLLDDLVGVVQPLMDNKPSARRTRRMFTTVVMPGR
jgi:hypothetical protein